MTNIISFKNINYNIFKNIDETERNIGYSVYNNIILTGRNNYYPNNLLYDINNKLLISPYDEKIMSLNKDSFYDDNIYDLILDDTNINKNKINEPLFFFIYNFDNYFHFLYDTLPYLYLYLELKKTIYNLKILVNYPNKNINNFYKFNTEFLSKIINLNDLIIHNNNNIYDTIYVSSSLTHGGCSNNPPRKEIYEIYDIIKNNINYDNINDKYKSLKKIYISRRTWINNDTSNIGTNYTTRRKMINEDTLVDILVSKFNFYELFCENLTTDEKIFIFSNANIICGSIGGGMSNLLFSNINTQSIIINTPYFLEINYRFKYTLENTNFKYFNDVTTYFTENNNISLFSRCKIITDKNNKIYYNKIGEITNIINNEYYINLSNNDIAGFNNLSKFDNVIFNINEFILLDKGLNSPYIVNIDKLLNFITN
jgi:hypothetical protein